MFINTKAATNEYRNGWDAIFSKNKSEPIEVSVTKEEEPWSEEKIQEFCDKIGASGNRMVLSIDTNGLSDSDMSVFVDTFANAASELQEQSNDSEKA